MKDLLNFYYKRAILVANILRFVPYVRLLSVSGSLADGNIKKDSDIDFFIITKHGRLWQTRFFIVIILKLFGLYRTGDLSHQKAAKICPNRWVTDKYLLIDPQNLYHAQEYSHTVPLYDENHTYQKFITKNSWIKKYSEFKIFQPKIDKKKPSIKKIFEWILSKVLGNCLEVICKKIQLRSILKDSRVNKPGRGLYVDDQQLRFHPDPRS